MNLHLYFKNCPSQTSIQSGQIQPRRTALRPAASAAGRNVLVASGKGGLLPSYLPIQALLTKQ